MFWRAVQFSAMKNKPPYPLASVDNALRLIHLLRDEGAIGVSEAAQLLGCGRSTAHRLLSMLVYRDFAVRDDNSRTYLPGAALTAAPLGGRGRLSELRRLAMPHLERLCDEVDESVNLMVRVGTHTRFLATVEGRQVLHVGDRQGTILPAHLSSGGKALLAELSPEHLADLYQRRSGPLDGDHKCLPAEEFRRLGHELERVRRAGYALNLEATEAGICAIGRVIRDPAGTGVAAISIAMPSIRFPRDGVEGLVQALTQATDRIEAELRAAPA